MKLKNNNDILDDNNYYILSLYNNIYVRNVRPLKLKKFYGYLNVPFIGEYKDGVMLDLITGKEVQYIPSHDKELVNCLSYWKAKRISKHTVSNMLKMLSKKDVLGYCERINKIEDISIKDYKIQKKLSKTLKKQIAYH